MICALKRVLYKQNGSPVVIQNCGNETDESFKHRKLEWEATQGKIQFDRDQAILEIKIQFLKNRLGIR